MRQIAAAGLVLMIVCGVIAPIDAQRTDAPPAQDEFVPISELPEDEKMPAAPLLIAAYAVIWVVIFVYVWATWRRIGAVDRELADLRKRLSDHSRR